MIIYFMNLFAQGHLLPLNNFKILGYSYTFAFENKIIFVLVMWIFFLRTKFASCLKKIVLLLIISASVVLYFSDFLSAAFKKELSKSWKKKF